MASMVWGSKWEGLSVRFHCDNSAVVALLNVGAVRDDSLMHLMKCLSFVSAKFNFVLSSCHIRGIDNTLADALSRNNLPLFLRSRQQARPTPTPLHLALQDPSEAGLDIYQVDAAVDFYFQHAIANSTQRTYASAQSRFLSFCREFSLQPLPVNEALLCRFASFLALQNLSHSSIKGYLSAISRLQIARGLPDPLISQMAKLEGVVRGIKSQQARPIS